MSAPELGAGRVAASSAVLLAENLVRLGVTAVVSFWIAHQLGPASFGLLNFASSLMAILLGVVALGLDIPATLRLTRPGSAGALLGTVIALRLLASLAGFAAMLIATALLRPNEPFALAVTMIVGLALVGYAPSVFDFWFKAHVEAGPPALMRLLSTLLSAALKIACLALDLGVLSLAWTIVFEAALSSGLLWLAWHRSPRRADAGVLAPNREAAHLLLRDGWPYLLSTVAMLLTMKQDVVLLGALASDTETGVYALVQKLSEVLFVVPVVLLDSAYPALARRARLDVAPWSGGQVLFDLAVAGALLAVLGGLLLGPTAIALVFGPRYAAALPLFQLHAWTCIAVALAAARYRWLGMVGLQRHAPLIAMSGAVINGALNVAMIPAYGARGAVWAALISYFVSGFLPCILIRELRPLGWMQLRALWPWSRLVTLGRRARAAPT